MNMAINSDKYRQCMDNAKRINWDIEDDVIRGRTLASSDHFMPVGLTMADKLHFLNEDDRRFFGFGNKGI